MARPPLDNNQSSNSIKFLCSYGGKIVPRHPDGKLRYLGGHIRVLAVDRSISFTELLLKMAELCGTTVAVRCQLPTEDLDALVSIKSDEDLVNIIEEYDLLASSLKIKIKAYLWRTKSKKTPSPPPSEINASSPTMLSPRSLSPSPMYSSSASSPKYGSSASSPKYGSSASSPKYGSSASSPKYGSSASSPKYGSAASSPKHGSAVSSPRYVHVPVTVTAFPICYGSSSNGFEKLALPPNQYGFHNVHSSSQVFLVHNGNYWQ